MPTTFTTPIPNEKGTAVLGVAFTDEDDSAVTPSTITWTLTDINGTIINNRDAESITPASSINIVMSGDDLALDAGVGDTRIVTVEWVYTSSYGVGLPGKDQAKFSIKDLVAVT